MTTTLQSILTERVAGWEQLGHPALLERFVLRNGKPYTDVAPQPARMAAKQCFGNATRWIRDHGGTYVEGFTMIPDIAHPIHHAWVVSHNDVVLDPTLADNTGYQYFGIAFETRFLLQTVLRAGYYGLLDNGHTGLNSKLMFERDPELEHLCKRITRRGPWVEREVRR